MAELNPPLGTTTPEIFMDNVKRADELVNGPAGTVDDRGGEPLDTWRQMMAKNDEVRQNIIPLNKQYQTLAAAQADIANIPEGSTTYYRSPDDSALAVEVINNAGTLVATGRKMPSQLYVEEVDRFARENLRNENDIPGLTPLITGETTVALWEEDGKLNGIPLHEDYIEQAQSGVFEYIDERLPLPDTPDTMKPLIVGDATVAIWEQEGKLNGIPLHKDYIDQIQAEINITPSTAHSLISQGVTQWLYRTKKAKLDIGLSSKLKIGFTGDSWTEHSTIPQVFADYFYAKYGKSGDGWIQLNIDNPNQLNGIVLARDGWSVYDASATSLNPTFPTAMDGQYIYATGTAATLSISNLFDTSIQIFYYDGTGTFRYSVNGGIPVVVTGAGTNKIVSVTVSGLNISAATTLSLDLTGNSGTVIIYGFYANGTGNGVEINKMGNGGITAPQYIKTLSYLSQTGTVVAPDVLIMIIGTNDFRTSVTLQAFRDGLIWWLNAWKAIVPHSAIILVAPAQCNASGANPLSAFRDIIVDVAKQNEVEFLSLYDFITTSWNTANLEGIWKDNLHMTNVGAKILCSLINKYFLE
ncbi:TPA: GDSL-type esterase/lipase family protein [Klebsiella michiganensis]